MGYSIKFTNFSKYEWTRSVNGSSVDAVLQNLSKTPSGHLKAQSGMEQMAADENSFLSNISSGAVDLHCCWYEPVTKQRFGIQLWVPFHMFTIGKAPYWYVMDDKEAITAAPNWVLAGNDPADVYEWKNLSGFHIRADPTSSHSSLDISVTIQAAN